MNRRLAITLGAGCALLVLLLVIAIPVVLLLPVQIGQPAVERDRSVEGAATPRPEMVATQQAVPTLTPSAVEARASEDGQAEGLEDAPRTRAS
jgi:hypothetical protein